MTREPEGNRQEVPFPEAIDPFINACPGPDIAIKALRAMAYQQILGIPGLAPSHNHRSRLSAGQRGNRRTPLSTLGDVARVVYCSPGHLSRVARRRGYSISLAIRWLRFLFGYVLQENGVKGEVIATRLGLSSASAWSRFVKELTGKAPSQLPRMPLNDWVREARRQVFLVPLQYTNLRKR